jgi:hypothetical protein
MSKPTRLVIENKGVGAIHERQFFLDIQAAILDGYRISESTKRIDATMRNYMGFMGRAVLVLPEDAQVEETSVETPEVETPVAEAPSVEEKVEEVVEAPAEEAPQSKLGSLKKKDDLLAYAEELGVEVPENVKAPMKIKKIIRESGKV